MENYGAETNSLPKLVVGNHVIVQDQKTKKWTLHGRVVETPPDLFKNVIQNFQ